MALVEVRDLKVHFKIQNGWVKAVDGVSFEIERGGTMGLVGESGCGKTTAAYAITQLLPPNGYIKGGQIFYKEPPRVTSYRREYDSKLGDSPKAREKEILGLRKRLQKLESGPRNAQTDAEVNDLGLRLASLEYSYDLLGKSKHKDGRLDEFNDEIRKIRWKEISMIITHDVSVVAEVSDKIAVMYAGKIVEIGKTAHVFKNTAHPYTAGLLGSFPSIMGPKTRLVSIPGFPPDLVNPPSGCTFHPRCGYAQDICSKKVPPAIEIEPGHLSYCLFANELWDKLKRGVK